MINIKIKSEANEVLEIIIKTLNENLSKVSLYDTTEISYINGSYLVSYSNIKAYLSESHKKDINVKLPDHNNFLFTMLPYKNIPTDLKDKYEKLNDSELEILDSTLYSKGVFFKFLEDKKMIFVGINKEMLFFRVSEKLNINIEQGNFNDIFEEIIISINKKLSTVKINKSFDLSTASCDLSPMQIINGLINNEHLDVFSNINMQKILENTTKINEEDFFIFNFNFPLSNDYLYINIFFTYDFCSAYKMLSEIEKEIIIQKLKTYGIFFGHVENRDFFVIGINKKILLDNIF